jgi:predicted N-acetyltransferase YhbS
MSTASSKDISMATLLRTATPADYDAILGHIDDSFGFAPGSFLRDSPHHWRPEFMDWAHILLAEDEGRIAALVRIFSLDLVQNGVPLRAGGIGAVSTANWACGRGHMTQLLEWAVRMMREEGFAVSLLWGDRHRYGAFGFESAGRVLQVSITDRGLQRLGVEARSCGFSRAECASIAHHGALRDESLSPATRHKRGAVDLRLAVFRSMDQR